MDKSHGISFGNRYYPLKIPRKPGPGAYTPKLPNISKNFSFGTSNRNSFQNSLKEQAPGTGEYKLPSVFDRAAKKKHIMVYIKEESVVDENEKND